MYNMGNFKIKILKDYEELSKEAANILSWQILRKPNSVLGLATGSTPLGLYKELVKLNKEEKVDFSKVKTFNLDEYYPIDKSNNQSYDYFMKKNLFKHVNIDMNNVNIPNGMAKDVSEECLQYDEKIFDIGGIDLQVLGIGLNGHIGFNEPSEFFYAGTHCVELEKSTIEANSRLFNSIDEVPKRALTMGIRSIMMSKKILLIVSGKNKQDIIHSVLFSRIIPAVPATILQLHRDVTILLDEDASVKIKGKLKK